MQGSGQPEVQCGQDWQTEHYLSGSHTGKHHQKQCMVTGQELSASVLMEKAPWSSWWGWTWGGHSENEAHTSFAAKEGRRPDPPGRKAALCFLLCWPPWDGPSANCPPSLHALQEPCPHRLLHCGPPVLPGDRPAGRRHGGLRRRKCRARDQGEQGFSPGRLRSAPQWVNESRGCRNLAQGWRWWTDTERPVPNLGPCICDQGC